MPALTTALAERFWARVDRGDDHWPWTGATDTKGHPVFAPRVDGQRYRWQAQQVAWTETGHELVDGHLVIRTCDEPRCVRPDHHQAGTQADLRRWTPEQRAARFWSRVDHSAGADACWPWLGRQSPDTGHGATRWMGQVIGAHVLALQLHIGQPVPAGAFVCHHCDSPPCCNPSHLYVGDAATNAADRVRRGRAHDRQGPDHAGAKLTAEQVREIRSRHAAGESYPTLGRAFGLHPQNIGRIVRREGYANVE